MYVCTCQTTALHCMYVHSSRYYQPTLKLIVNKGFFKKARNFSAYKQNWWRCNFLTDTWKCIIVCRSGKRKRITQFLAITYRIKYKHRLYVTMTSSNLIAHLVFFSARCNKISTPGVKVKRVVVLWGLFDLTLLLRCLLTIIMSFVCLIN